MNLMHYYVPPNSNLNVEQLIIVGHSLSCSSFRCLRLPASIWLGFSQRRVFHHILLLLCLGAWWSHGL